MWETIATAAVTSLFTSLAVFVVQERRLKAELRTEFMAEAALKALLESPKWKMRSFREIKKRVGGFEDNDLRQLLVRSGAVRFEGKDDSRELWGLRDKNATDL